MTRVIEHEVTTATEWVRAMGDLSVRGGGAPAKKAPTKKAPAKKAPTKKAPAKKAPAKKAAAKKAPAKKAAAKKSATKATAKKAAPKRTATKAATGKPELPSPVTDPLAILGLTPSHTTAELKKAWREFASRHHPDQGGDALTFARGRAAYDHLRRHLDDRR